MLRQCRALEWYEWHLVTHDSVVDNPPAGWHGWLAGWPNDASAYRPFKQTKKTDLFF